MNARQVIQNLIDSLSEELKGVEEQANVINRHVHKLRGEIGDLEVVLPVLEKYLSAPPLSRSSESLVPLWGQEADGTLVDLRTSSPSPDLQDNDPQRVDPFAKNADSLSEEIERQRQAVNALIIPYRFPISAEEWAKMSAKERYTTANDLERWQRESGPSKGRISTTPEPRDFP